MPKPHNNLWLLFFTIMVLSGCGGGGGGGGGGSFGLNNGPVSGSFDISTATSLPVYQMPVQTGMTYTINLVSTSGDADLEYWDADPNTNSSATLLGWSFNSGSNLDQGSFIASFDGTVYITPFSLSTTAAVSYTVEATSNNLTVDAPAVTDNAYNTSLYYSFDAQAGVAYQVYVAPSVGDVNISAVSPNTSLSASLGSSSNSGTTPDSIYFTAAATARYYIKISTTSTDSTFGIQVKTVPTAPDLTVSINNAVSDGSNVTVSYTVYNNGVNTYNGDVQVDVWSNASSAPVVGATGEGYDTLTGTSISGLGGSVSGSVTVPNSTGSGTAYAIVDTIDAIAEGNESNNVSGAKGWTKPIIAPASYDFENAVIPTQFVSSGDASWIIDNTTGGSGSSVSMRSGTITDSQRSCFSASVYNAQGTQISFDYSVSAESFDDLRFYVDGTLQNTWSGIVSWSTATFSTSSGLHTYKWCYVKDFSYSSGSDTAWVDNINITAMPIDLSITVNGVSSDSANVTIDYTVTNNGTGDAGAFDVDLWSDSTSVPVVGNMGETSQSYSGLTAGSSVSGSAVIANSAASGTAYAIVDTSNVVSETDETNNVSAGTYWETPPTAPVSYDFESGTVPAKLGMSGDAGWTSDNTTASSSTISLRSGVISNSQSSCTALTVLNTSGISFDYSVSSEGSFDFLHFYIDGVVQNSWSGTVAWTNTSYTVTTGTHTYKWCYIKDSSASSGLDAAWIDNISAN